MKIYLVLDGDSPSDRCVSGVFTDLDKAMAYADKLGEWFFEVWEENQDSGPPQLYRLRSPTEPGRRAQPIKPVK